MKKKEFPPYPPRFHLVFTYAYNINTIMSPRGRARETIHAIPTKKLFRVTSFFCFTSWGDLANTRLPSPTLAHFSPRSSYSILELQLR